MAGPVAVMRPVRTRGSVRRGPVAVVILAAARSVVVASTASNASANCPARSRIRNRNPPARSPRSINRFRACCTVHAPSRCAVTPRTCTWRVPTSSTENTCSRRKVTAQSTWKKSHASLVEAWVRRNCRHVDRARSGAGGMRSRWRERQQDPWKLGVPTTVLPVVKWQGGGGGHSRGSGDIGGVPVALELHRDLMTRDVGAGHVTGTRRRSRAPRRRRFWRAGR